MDERELAETLLRDLFKTAGALTVLQLRHLAESAKLRVNDAVREGTAHLELRVRLDRSETWLVLVPTDGSDPLWLTRTPP